MNITQGLHRAVQLHPNATATISGDRVTTHAESIDRVARLAGALRALGVSDGQPVAILSLNSDRYHESLCAVLWAGGAVVPVNLRWSRAEIGGSLNEVGARVMIVDDVFAELSKLVQEDVPLLTDLIYAGDAATPGGMSNYEELIAATEPIEDAWRGGDDLAAVMYTGGTTGVSKGVMLSHDNLMASSMGTLASSHFLTLDGVLLHTAPMFHLADLAAWLGQVIRGGAHVMLPTFEPVLVLSTIEKHKVTDALLVPTMIQLLVDHPRAREFDLSSFQRLVYGGSPIAPAVLARAMSVMPNTRFTQMYGMTELSPVCTILSHEDHLDPTRIAAAGRPAPHSEVMIQSPDDSEAPRGQVGEICSRGPHVMLGYFNRPMDTADAVRDGWMHTGDIGYMDEDGFVFVADRLKDMIISGGENIYSLEVENTIAKHPAVATVAVVGVPDDHWGERVHAVIVLAPDGTLELEELRDFCKLAIAGYKVPKTMELVQSLPLSAAGKVLKRDLREVHWAGSQRAVH